MCQNKQPLVTRRVEEAGEATNCLSVAPRNVKKSVLKCDVNVSFQCVKLFVSARVEKCGEVL